MSIRTLLLAAAGAVCMAAWGQKSITTQEYWLDGRIANRATLDASPATLPLGHLQPGLHSFSMRVQDSDELWSSVVTRFFLLPDLSVEATAVAGREYWIDGRIANRTTLDGSPVALPLDNLQPGLHSFSMRVQDDAGLWSSVVTKYFVIPQAVDPATNILEREYWLDGKVAARATLDGSPAQIDLADLAAGVHSFTLRSRDNNGRWSAPVTKFFVLPQAEITVAKYMYWFDDDETNQVVGELTEPEGVLPIDLTALEDGEHTLNFRVADSRGKWSEARAEAFTFQKIVTSLDSDGAHLEGSAPRKIVSDGTIYILLDDKTFTISGQDISK